MVQVGSSSTSLFLPWTYYDIFHGVVCLNISSFISEHVMSKHAKNILLIISIVVNIFIRYIPRNLHSVCVFVILPRYPWNFFITLTITSQWYWISHKITSLVVKQLSWIRVNTSHSETMCICYVYTAIILPYPAVFRKTLTDWG